MQFLLALIWLYPLFTPTPPVTAEVEYVFHNIRNEKGLIRLGAYNTAGSFTDHPAYTFAFDKKTMQGGQLVGRFSLPEGTYAFSILDDENRDEEMNFNLIGIPKEGYGFSKDAPIKFLTPPSFEDCAVQVSPGKQRLRMKVRYF
ncbi:MAG: DUF2141 domain-containing protein [Bacteroidota bacterium]